LHQDENGDGFITDENGLSIYFRFSQCDGSWQTIQNGKPVSFKAKRVNRKGKESYQAQKVYLSK
jgi:cold shock CspA family protein